MKIKRVFRPWRNKILQRLGSLLLISGLLLGTISQTLSALTSATLQVTPVSETQSTGVDVQFMVVKNKIAFVADYMSGSVRAVDMNDPNTPTVLSVATGPNQPYVQPLGIVSLGNYAYVYGHDKDFTESFISSYDISNPNSVHYLGTYSGGAIAGCVELDLVATQSTLVANVHCTSTLVALDTSNPANLTAGASFNYSSYSTANWSTRTTTAYDSSSVVVSFAGQNYLYLEIAAPSSSSLTLTSAVPMSATGFTAANYASLITLRSGIYAYVFHHPAAAQKTDVRVYDVSTPASPVLVANQTGVYSENNLRYWSFVSADSVIIDNALVSFATPSSPIPSNRIGSGYMFIRAVENGLAYISGGYGSAFQIGAADVSPFQVNPPIIGTSIKSVSNWVETYTIALDNTTVLSMGTYLNAVRLLDVSDPNNLRATSTQYLTDSSGGTIGYSILIGSPVLSNTKQSLYAAEIDSLMFFDMSDRQNIHMTDRITFTSGDVRVLDSVVVGSTWYVLTGTRTTSRATLQAYALDETAKTITLLSSRNLTKPYSSLASAPPRYLEIVGNNAIALSHEQAVEVLDITNPSAIGAPVAANLPALSNYLMTNPYTVESSLLVPVHGILYAIDASNPAAMSIQSSVANRVFVKYYTNGIHDANNFSHLDATTLFYVNPSENPNIYPATRYPQGTLFAKIDVSNMNNITITQSVEDGTGLFNSTASRGWGGIYPLPAVIGDIAIGADGVAANIDYSFNISDLANPQPLDVMNDPTPMAYPSALEFVGDHAYVGSLDYGEWAADLATFDITNPTQPVYDGTTVHMMSGPVTMKASGTYLYAFLEDGELMTYDTTNIDFPLPVSTYYSPSSPYMELQDMAISGDYLYGADPSNGLAVLSLTDPAKPAFITSFNDVSFSSLTALTVNGNYLYGLSATENVLVVIDVSNPSSPTLVKTVSASQFEGLTKIAQVGTTLYAVGTGGINGANFTAFDVSNPADPTLLGSYVGTPNAQYKDIQIYGEFALLAASGTASVDVLDISNPANIVADQQITTGTTALAGVSVLRIRNNQLYTLATDGESMNIYDLHVLGATSPTPPTVNTTTSDNGKPTLTGTYDPTASGLTVTVNDVTYVLGSSTQLSAGGGVWTLDLTSLTEPIPSGTYNVVATSSFSSSTLTDSTVSELVINTSSPTPIIPSPSTPAPTLAPTGSENYLLMSSGVLVAAGAVLLIANYRSRLVRIQFNR